MRAVVLGALVVCASTLLVEAEARAEGRAPGLPQVALDQAFRSTGQERSGQPLVDASRCSFIVGVNMSANHENGVVGQQIREALRGLMNRFLVDGEQITLVPFQLNLETEEQLEFTARERLAIYDRIDSICSRAGRRGGGSDVEQAKYRVLSLSRNARRPVLCAVLTNHDKSQEPSIKPAGWKGLWIDTGQERLTAELSERMGVRWQKVVIASEKRSDRTFATYLHLALRRGNSLDPLEGGRPQNVERQNETYPQTRIPAPNLPAIKLTAARRVGPNRFQLEWQAEGPHAAGYQLLLRHGSQPKVLRTHFSREQKATVEVPPTGQEYAITVAASDGPAGEAGPESGRAVVRSRRPDPTLSFLAVGGVLAAAGGCLYWWVRRTTVRINSGTPRTLSKAKPVFTIRTPAAAGSHDDVVLDGLPNNVGVLAHVEFPALVGGPRLKAGKGMLLHTPSGRKVPQYDLSPGRQQITIASEEDETMRVTLDILVGDRDVPARVAPGATRPAGGRPQPPPRR